MRDLATLEPERAGHGPEAFCRKVWDVLRRLYVTDPADAHRITWARCDLPNEQRAMQHFTERTLPSMRALDLTDARTAVVRVPVLVVHGTRDRSAPYGGGREWALRLSNARLLAVDGAGHAPWVEAPDVVLDAIEAFLGGEWPRGTERVDALDPEAPPGEAPRRS